MASIRERIEVIGGRLRNPDNIFGEEGSQLLVELSALLSSVNVEIVQAEHEYNVVKRDLLATTKSVSEAKVHAEATDAWKKWKDRVAAGKSCEEMIKSLKYLLRNLEEERKIMPNK